jgi:hypothetical protein
MRKRKMLMWVLSVGVGAVLAVVLIVPLVGARLPDTYRAAGSVTLDRPAAELWAELVDFEAHPRAGKLARGVERLPDVDGRPSWREDLGQTRVTWTVVEWDPPRRLVCEARDSVVPMTARWETDVEDLDGAARMVLRNETVIRPGTWHVPLFRVIMTVTGGARRGMTDYLRTLDPTFDPATVAWE